MICPDCGQNLPENGVCYNCQKNRNDAKRFGRGSGIIPAYIKYGPHTEIPRYKDKGPKRRSPEMTRQEGRATLPGGRAVQSRKARAEQSKIVRPVRRSYAPRAFVAAIGGDWVNLSTKEIVTIRGRGNRWQIRKKLSKKQPVLWGIGKVTRRQIVFTGPSKSISARVAADGVLVLQGGGREARFGALIDGQWQRICGKCFLLSPWRAPVCTHCCKPFDRG